MSERPIGEVPRENPLRKVKAVASKKKKTPLINHPTKCPRGHKHLSFSPGEKEFFCWDCHKYYPVSEYLSRAKDLDWKEEEPEK